MALFRVHKRMTSGGVIYRQVGSTIPLTMGKNMFEGFEAPDEFTLDLPNIHAPWRLDQEAKSQERAAKKAADQVAKDEKKRLAAEKKAADKAARDEKNTATKAEKEAKRLA